MTKRATRQTPPGRADRTVVRTLAVLVLSLGLAAPTASGQEPGPEGAADTDSRAPPALVVEVAGLTCPFCAYGLEKKFLEAPAVDSVSVGLEEGEVRLWLEPGGELTDERARRIVRDAGFTPGEIRRPPSP